MHRGPRSVSGEETSEKSFFLPAGIIVVEKTFFALAPMQGEHSSGLKGTNGNEEPKRTGAERSDPQGEWADRKRYGPKEKWGKSLGILNVT